MDKNDAVRKVVSGAAQVILDDKKVVQAEAVALLRLLEGCVTESSDAALVNLHRVTQRVLADDKLDTDEAEELRVLLGEFIDADLFAPLPVAPPAAEPNRALSPVLLELGMTVIMKYENSKGEVSEREVLVRKVASKNGVVYLGGVCLMRNAYRTFRVDRIVIMIVKNTGELVENVEAAMA